MIVNGKAYRTVWMEGGKVLMVNQHLLPSTFRIATMRTAEETSVAIRDMIVRGAPAIGATGAYGLVQVVLQAARSRRTVDVAFRKELQRGYTLLWQTRPTAQNLFYALDRVKAVVHDGMPSAEACTRAMQEAERIAEEDIAACRSIGEAGAALIEDGMTVLTHCNAGWLATVDWGTALAPIYVAKRQGKKVRVFADETRPRSQGARLTSWELSQEGIDVTVIADNAAGHFLHTGQIDLCIVGADRIAANGDTANKIGTYEKAVVAKENGVPFYIAAPWSTFDLHCATGRDIPIEERAQDEVLYADGFNERGHRARVRLAAAGVSARNPAFDVTPAKYLSGIITERGIIAPNKQAIRRSAGSQQRINQRKERS